MWQLGAIRIDIKQDGQKWTVYWCVNKVYTILYFSLEGSMGNFIDRTNQRFGKLVVLKEAGRNAHKKVMWECICDCGGTVTASAGALITGNTKSCGCCKGYIKHICWLNYHSVNINNSISS